MMKELVMFLKESGLRKIALAFHFFNVVSFLVAKGRIGEAVYLEIVTWLIVVVFCANAIEWWVKKKGGHGGAATPSPS